MSELQVKHGGSRNASLYHIIYCQVKTGMILIAIPVACMVYVIVIIIVGGILLLALHSE